MVEDYLHERVVIPVLNPRNFEFRGNYSFPHFLSTGISQLKILSVFQILFFIVIISFVPERQVPKPSAGVMRNRRVWKQIYVGLLIQG
jgi:hypothetical protein